jgi:hypothetical protein
MNIRVQAKIAPPGVVRFWVGLFNRGEAPEAPPRLRFRIDGAAIEPRVLRPLSAFRSGALRGDARERRVFSGVYEHASGAGRAGLRLSVAVVGEGGEMTTELRTLPAEVPSLPGQQLNVLLTSCYYHKGDHAQAVAEVIRGLPSSARPDLVLFLGDQVYLDLPTTRDFADDAAWLAREFETRYQLVYNGPYTSAFDAAPSGCVPDDHEYWNDYPNPFVVVQNSWTIEGRQRWTQAAKAALAAFQLGSAAQIGEPIVFDIAPLSFFLADTRSGRDPGGKWSLDPQTKSLEKLEQWANEALTRRRYPVFVSGQSLLDAPGGSERVLSNYADYPRILEVFGRLARSGRCPLLITGDVHYGRVAYAVDASGRPRAFELISSPASLVDTLFADAAHALFGSGTWPKHPKPEDPPSRIRVGAAVWEARAVHKQRGNHVTLVSFRCFAGSLQFKATFWPVHSRQTFRKPTELAWIDLSSRN